MSNYYTDSELKLLGFKCIGINNKISKKSSFYGIQHISIENNCRIDDNCVISASKNEIQIGNFVHISNNVSILGGANIKIEDFVGLSSKVSIFGSTDDYTGNFMTNPCVGAFNDKCTNIKTEDIIIGKHAIIGCNSIILPGCSIISGASVGALSLVNRKITKLGIYQGNPIEYIKDKSTNYLKIEEQYFTQFNNSILENNIDSSNSNCSNNYDNNNNLYSMLNKYINNLDTIKKKDIKLLDLGIDSLSFIQIQNFVYKNYNIKINENITLNDILKFDNIDKNKQHDDSNKIIKKDISKINNNTNNVTNSNCNNITIIGTAHKLASKKIPNDFYEQIVDTNNEWIKKRTGIENKFILGEEETLEELIINSSLESISNANIDVKDIDLIILASSTPEDLFGDASKIAYKIGAINAFAFDIRNACNGFLTSLVTAENFLKNNNNKYKIALVIGADCLSRYINWTDRKSNVLFGDGVGCVILKKSQSENDGILSSLLKTNGEYNDILNIYSKKTYTIINDVKLISNKYENLVLDGISVYNFVIENLPNYIIDFLNSNKININDIKYFILHQANIRIIEEISNKLNIEKEKFLYNIDNVGNTSAASIPILLDEKFKNNEINKDDLLLISTFGAGMSSGMMIFKWTMEKKTFYDKVALVTGGTKGIGKSISIKLKNKGYKTIICSRSEDTIICSDIDYYKIDVSNCNDIKKLYDDILKKYGRLDILVNNAGIEGSNKSFINSDIEDIQQIININLFGTLYTTNIMIDLLKKSKGTIINISSISAGNNISNCHRRTLYSLTKSSIGTFTRGLAGELKNICNVYSLNPPFVDTDLLDRIIGKNDINKEVINEYGTIKNLTQLIKPRDISNIVSLLIDGKTRYKSGDEILVIASNQTSYMKYLYEKLNDRDNNKFEIKDIEYYPVYNLCLFQGQGLELNINYELIKNYIILNNYNELLIKVIKLTFDELTICYNNDVNNTFYQQIIIFISSYVLFNIEKNNEELFFENIKYMAGYSIGEISALVCSKKITFEDGLNIVYVRGYNMHLISEEINTSMTVVKGMNIEEIEKHLSKNLFISIKLNKNLNILGGDRQELDNFKKKCDKNILFNDLLVEGAYHTPYYIEVSYKLDDILNKINYNENNIEVVSNYNSVVYNNKNFKDLIKKQIHNTVEWFNTMKKFKQYEIVNIKEIKISNNNFLLKQFDIIDK